MGSTISKPFYHYYIPPQFQNDNILIPLVDKVFNRKLNQDALLILLKNHNLSMLNKIRIVIIHYLTLHKNISKQLFNRLTYVLEFINTSICQYQDETINTHYYPQQSDSEPAPPLYTEN